MSRAGPASQETPPSAAGLLRSSMALTLCSTPLAATGDGYRLLLDESCDVGYPTDGSTPDGGGDAVWDYRSGQERSRAKMQWIAHFAFSERLGNLCPLVLRSLAPVTPPVPRFDRWRPPVGAGEVRCPWLLFSGRWMRLGPVDDLGRIASMLQHLAAEAEVRIPLAIYRAFVSVPGEA